MNLVAHKDNSIRFASLHYHQKSLRARVCLCMCVCVCVRMYENV